MHKIQLSSQRRLDLDRCIETPKGQPLREGALKDHREALPGDLRGDVEDPEVLLGGIAPSSPSDRTCASRPPSHVVLHESDGSPFGHGG